MKDLDAAKKPISRKRLTNMTRSMDGRAFGDTIDRLVNAGHIEPMDGNDDMPPQNWRLTKK